jgi:hypothetical protein
MGKKPETDLPKKVDVFAVATSTLDELRKLTALFTVVDLIVFVFLYIYYKDEMILLFALSHATSLESKIGILLKFVLALLNGFFIFTCQGLSWFLINIRSPNLNNWFTFLWFLEVPLKTLPDPKLNANLYRDPNSRIVEFRPEYFIKGWKSSSSFLLRRFSERIFGPCA